MILAVNIGNTTISCALFEGEKIVTSWKLSTHTDTEIFSTQKIPFTDITGVVLGSVVPKKTQYIIAQLENNHLPSPLIINGSMNLPIKLAIDTPNELGADIIADLAGAKKHNTSGVIIIDSGTATTLNVLSKDNDFLGTVIAPGMEMLAKSLTENTALLPEITLEKAEKLLGTNTIECMRSGIYFGYIGMVKEILTRLKKEFPHTKVIGTGGNIEKIADEVPEIEVINTTLTLEGLYTIYTYTKN